MTDAPSASSGDSPPPPPTPQPEYGGSISSSAAAAAADLTRRAQLMGRCQTQQDRPGRYCLSSCAKASNAYALHCDHTACSRPDFRLRQPTTAFSKSPVAHVAGTRMAEEGRLLAGAGDPILPPRLEDAGLEDCALPPESIAEAFSLAAMAVSSRLPHLSLSDDEDEDEGDDPLAPRGGCVEDAGPTCGTIPDALVGAGGGCVGDVDKVVVIGAGRAGGGGSGDEVVVVGRGDEEDRVVVVGEELGEKLGEEKKGCVEGIREGEEEEETEQEAVEKAILLEDFAKDLEDGYTLHLVARRTAGGQYSSETSEESTHANVNIAGNGRMLGDMSRTVRDILGALGLGMPGGVANATFAVPLTTAPEGANNASGRTQPGNPAQPGFSILNHQIQVSQLQPGGAIPRNMVIPDSLTTLLEYINGMDQVLQNNGVPSVDSNAQQPPRSDDAYLNQRFPSPEVLVSVVEKVQQLLGGSASSALSHLAQRIQRDAATGDTSIRSQIQNESAQLGVAMQHLGAMLLELGRTMMMLRMGASPANAFVNAGSAVYINPTGPNPIMVQPSFQSAPHFGVSSIPVLSGVSGAFGIVDPSQTSGVNTHGGASATSGPSAGTTTGSATTVNGDRQNVERTQGGNPSANSTRGLPTRTVVAAIPARSSAEVPNHVLSVIVPVQVRSQVAAPNHTTVSQGSQTAVGNGSQPNSTFVVPQASSGGGVNIPSIVAQITAQVANALAANPPGEVSSSVQNTADQGSHPTTNNGAGTLSSAESGNTQPQTDLPGQTSLNVQSHVTGAGTLPSNTSDPNLTPQDSSTVNVSSVDSIQQHSQMEDIHVDIVGAHSGESVASSYTSDVPLSMSAENSEQNNRPSDGVTEEPIKPSASERSEPLGLGGGLQSKRRSRIAKPSGTRGDSGESLNTSSVNRNQEAVSAGQKVLQALVSKNTDVSSSSVTDSHPPSSSTRQFAGGMPLRRPGGEGQVDISSMLSSVLNSPVFGNLVSNVGAQTGMESPADLRNIMEEFTQSPAMMDTLGNMVQNVDGPGRGQGGFDLSRMMQQMMPVVSQVLGGATARPAGESRLQPRHNDGKVGNTSDGRNSQIDLHQACQRIEQHDSPEDIFGAVLETAAQAYGEDESIQVMLEELASDPELTDDYLKLLLQQVGERIQSESETKQS